MVQFAGGQKRGGGKRGARDRSLRADDLRIGQEARDGDQRRLTRSHADHLKHQQQHTRENRDVPARDGDDVIDGTLLQPTLRISVETCPVADEHRGDDPSRPRTVDATESSTIQRTAARSAVVASAKRDPCSTTSTSSPLLTEPSRLVPRHINARR